MKILIVDDSKAMRMIVKRTLKQAGYGDATMSEATNGREGLDAVKADAPDIVLCDWNMPEMNGIEFLRALRAEGNDVNFGFVTSEGTTEMRQQAQEAGAAFLISKPFTANDFSENIAAAVS
ncbi:MAG TPA: response regulator [Candidatus Krumholzibacteria bacterium]|nr:response regulator [Candidatus Krumholzibacteria bacterium]